MSQQGAVAEWDLPLVQDLLRPFTMQEDVRDEVVAEFLKGTSLYQCVTQNVRAETRVINRVAWALQHKGNLVAALDGEQRHGKSTVGRFICVILFLLQQIFAGQKPTLAGWENAVIYDQSYSSITNRIKEMVEAWEAEGCNPAEILRRIRYYAFIFDEVWIEHEEESQKAVDDLKNLLNTVAKAQIHFLFISPVYRKIGAYFRLWVVGFDEVNHTNLSFYFDRRGVCRGILITPQILETDKYDASKDAGIVEMLRMGGRAVAVKKELDEVVATAAPPTPMDVEASDSFEKYAVERCRREYSEIHTRILDLTIVQGLPQVEVAEQVLGTAARQVTVHQHLKAIRQRSIGYWFEDWWCLRHGQQPNQAKNQPDPDALIQGVPYSLKCYMERGRTYTIPKYELRPELRFAEQQGTGLVLVVYNLYRHQSREIKYGGPNEVPDPINVAWSGE